MISFIPLLVLAGQSEPHTLESPRESYLSKTQVALVTGGAAVLDEHKYYEIGAEWRLPKTTWDLIPIVGLTAIEGGSYYTYAGIRYEAALWGELFLAPSFAAGIYEEDGGFDLGGPIEFRSALELGYRVNDWLSVGLTFYHLSNARLYRSNRGSESLVLSFGVDVLALFD